MCSVPLRLLATMRPLQRSMDPRVRKGEVKNQTNIKKPGSLRMPGFFTFKFAYLTSAVLSDLSLIVVLALTFNAST